MILDFDNREGPDALECELCIVGSGPVGLAIALAFEGSPVRVVVLETGGDAHEAAAEAVSAFENAGQRRVHPSAVRRRIFGGTSSVWSGRCMPFAALDLQKRDWIGHSGWPLQGDALAPYLQRAGHLLQAGPAVYDDGLWALLGEQPPQSPWDPATFETQVFQASVVRHARTREIPAPVDPASGSLEALSHSSVPQAEDIAEMARGRLQVSRNVTVLLHAHALEVETDATGGRAEAVRIQSPSGRSGRVRAREVVLACGAIDNARLLLLSRSKHVNGLGNSFDVVGRYLMDHHYAVVATLEGTQGRRLRRRMGYRWFDVKGQRHVVVTGASLSAQRQREEQLPRATLFTFEHVARPAAITASRQVAQSLRGGHPADDGAWQAALLHPVGLARDVVDRYLHHRPPLSPVHRIDIGCNVEQLPDAESRVTLSGLRDAFGQPRARIDWRLDEREYRGYTRTAELFELECRRLQLETPQRASWVREPVADWRQALHDMAHPMGTTRMHNDPRHGVVDCHGAVHGIEGLHVAGSSVFPTGGTSNPTLMAVALALRLADRLKVSFTPMAIEQTREPRIRVGLIGAGARMRQCHVPVLSALQDHFEVVGVASRGEEGRQAMASANGWKAFDSLPALVAGAQPDFLLVAVGNQSNVPVLYQAMGLGLPLLAETPLSWNERDGRALVAQARGRGISLGILEQFPFTPAEQLKRKLISLGAIGAVTAAVNDFASYDYHGLAQLRAYAGYGHQAQSVSARRVQFGRTGVREGGEAEEWLLGTICMSGGVLLLHNYSAGYAMLPTRPPGQLRVLGQAGSFVGEQAIFVDRTSGARSSAVFERSARSIGVTHPALGLVEWEDAFAATPLTEEQRAVALHVEAFRGVVRDGGVPLYSGAQALGDIELLRALYYSSQRDAAPVRLPLRTRHEQVRVAARRIGRKLRISR